MNKNIFTLGQYIKSISELKKVQLQGKAKVIDKAIKNITSDNKKETTEDLLKQVREIKLIDLDNEDGYKTIGQEMKEEEAKKAEGEAAKKRELEDWEIEAYENLALREELEEPENWEKFANEIIDSNNKYQAANNTNGSNTNGSNTNGSDK